MDHMAAYKTNKMYKVIGKKVLQNWALYLFLLPSAVILLLLNVIPMYGIQIAFKKFVANQGIWGSKWIGFSNFSNFFSSYMFSSLIKNTLAISLYSIVVSFPFPILLALLLNYCVHPKLKKTTQMVTYAPHFISTVVLIGMINVFFSSEGLVNTVTELLGGSKVSYLESPSIFRHLYVWSHIWQRTGYNSVIYIAALSGISMEIHEAAIVDGANKLQRAVHIDLPSILPTAVILLIMSTGNVLSVGYEKVYLMQNDLNLSASEIISTYVYKIGLANAQYSYSTAIGLFNNVVNVIILMTVNKIADKLSGSALL